MKFNRFILFFLIIFLLEMCGGPLLTTSVPLQKGELGFGYSVAFDNRKFLDDWSRNGNLFFSYGVGNNIDIFLPINIIFYPGYLVHNSSDLSFKSIPPFTLRKTIYKNGFSYSFGLASSTYAIEDFQPYNNLGLLIEYRKPNLYSYFTLTQFIGYTKSYQDSDEGFNWDITSSFSLSPDNGNNYFTLSGSANFWLSNFYRNYHPSFKNIMFELKGESY